MTTAQTTNIPVSVNYTGRDFYAIRNQLITRIQDRVPEWTGSDPSDFGVVLVEAFSYMGDMLSYYIDRTANETSILTATQRANVLNLAQTYGYTPSGYRQSFVEITITNSSDTDVTLPVGTVVSGQVATADKVQDVYFTLIEEALITADVGVDTTLVIIEKIQARVSKDKYLGTDALNGILQEEIRAILVDDEDDTLKRFDIPEGKKPFVMLVVGVNGVGKTTTIGKLATNFKAAGKTVMLGAADTFRAAAVDQLTIWSERAGVAIVKKEMGSDPASVAFDTVNSAVAKDVDIVIIDTAGRLHNKAHLMEELSKIKRVIQKVIPDAPHETLLVLDGTTGQNAIEQARHFSAATDVSALAITKLDGTAKGGIVLAIANQFKIPVKFIGVGEQASDLIVFDKKAFVEGLFKL
jgi:fused signal recognition particle receptor